MRQTAWYRNIWKVREFNSVYLLIVFAWGKTRKIIIALAKLIAFLQGFNLKTFSLQNKWSYLTVSLRIHPILCSPVKVHRLIHVNGVLFARFETIEVFNSKKRQQKIVCRKTIVRETDEQYCNCASRPMRFMIIALAAISSTVMVTQPHLKPTLEYQQPI